MRSFSLIKTNVGLTSNVKITIDSNDNLYLDSINSNSILTNDKYKKFPFNKDSYYDSLLSKFYNGLNQENVFFIKNDNDNTIMYNSFDKQLDDIYISGAENIQENKFYNEDFEYFAPLYVSKTGLPKYFIIFRIDGQGITNLNKDNFKEEYLTKMKVVEVKDLTSNSQLGQWLNLNIIRNTIFPNSGFEMDFRNLQFSYWNGIDYIKGIWKKQPYYFDEVLEYENTFYDLEKFIYDGFKNNNLVYSNILNFNFLFNDTPATPTSLRNWSINRYAGFYLDDMIYYNSVTTYLSSVVVSDCEILTGNILTSTFNKPFNDATLKQSKIFIEIEGQIYQVINKQVTIAGFETNQWAILSDKDLTGKQALINKNFISIDSNNKITYLDGSSFIIDGWNTADVWIIKIGNKYHTLQYTNGDYYIYTDYAFTINSSTLNYYINYPDESYNTTIDMLSGNSWTASNTIINNQDTTPIVFPIYKLQFSDVKNFDETLVETKFAHHQYDLENEVTQTDEPKMHMTDLMVDSIPKPKVDFLVESLVTNIPATSHYTANNELFRVIPNYQNNSYDLTALWSKNAAHVKWGFKNSLSTNEWPYYLNNAFIAETHNKTANNFAMDVNKKDRNLDWFYTINSSTASWLYHSLHIEDIQYNTINQNYSFDVYNYLSQNYDYFQLFFDRKVYRNNSSIVENISKFSSFNTGDNTIPNITLFNGLKINLYDVSSIKLSNGLISNINTTNNNTYDDYKFSILMSKNNWTIETDTNNLNKISITSSNNTLEWSIIENWKLQKEYDLGSIVNYEEIFYISLTNSFITDPNYNPSNSSNWTYSNVNTLFFSPTLTYSAFSGLTLSNIVYNYGEYYYNNGSSVTGSFYIPNTTYATGSIVIYQNSVWESTIYPNNTSPKSLKYWQDNSNNYVKYWKQIDFIDNYGSQTTKWNIVPLWNASLIYTTGQLVVYNGILYYANSVSTIGVTPETSTNWINLYSLIPNSSTIYNSSKENNLIYYNNRYYLCSSNSNNSSLDNGIYVFINKVFKNVLINIYINDNTLTNLSNIDRDYLYSDLYTNLTANNFIDAINDVQNTYGFINNIKYIVYDTTGTTIYDFAQVNSYKNIPVILKIDKPDLINSRLDSLIKTAVTLKPNQIKATLTLDNGVIPSLSKKDYFNNISLASTLEKNPNDPEIIANVSGLTNKIYNSIYRHSGVYDPIFTTIDLFQKGVTFSSNTIFDTSLTNFGILKESILSKINRNGSQLKLRNSPSLKSIYPMLDEFGYTTKDMFIFKSNWDIEYYTECQQVITTIKANMVDTPVYLTQTAIPPKYLS